MASRSNKRKRTDEEKEETLIEDYERLMSKPANVDYAANYLFDTFLNDIITNLSFRAHFEEKNTPSEKELDLTDMENEITDILVTCLNCNKVVSSAKFASHLGEFSGSSDDFRGIFLLI
jgi:phage FluMu protein Com